ncbi:MAG: hypothetical protein RLZZ437_1024 [Pseudomonadota bacterium]|jgi:hypothetical protein
MTPAAKEKGPSRMAPQVRLFLFHSEAAPLTVILRRGPSEHHRLILWHHDGDRFEDGQWLMARVDPDLCALSPDGRHMLVQINDGAQWRHGFGCYTVLCRPPYFTALSLFPQPEPWIGGGAFYGTAHYAINARVPAHDLYANDTGMTRVFATGRGLVFLDNTPFDPPPAQHVPAPRCVAEGGQLFRVLDGARSLIRDFTDMTFSPIRAPYADQTGNRAPWHPLDAEVKLPCP